MAELAIRESEQQPLQFELMIHGQTRTYKCQAASADVKQMWVTEIRRLLQAQFMLMKGTCAGLVTKIEVSLVQSTAQAWIFVYFYADKCAANYMYIVVAAFL